MDSISQIKPGHVLRPSWDDTQYHVLAVDGHQFMYEAWLRHKNAWSLAKLPRLATYYRISARLVHKIEIVGDEPLSELQKNMHRPDLPLCCCRSAALAWEGLPSLDQPGFEKWLLKSSPVFCHRLRALTLAASPIALVPFGPKGAHLRGTLVDAADNQGFNGLELLWKAAQWQPKHPVSPTKGVGIYRSGLVKGLPSFYLWGGIDQASNYSEPET